VTGAEHYREGERLLALAEATDLHASQEDYRTRADARQLAIAHLTAAIAGLLMEQA
jgi:hypothetical protein